MTCEAGRCRLHELVEDARNATNEAAIELSKARKERDEQADENSRLRAALADTKENREANYRVFVETEAREIEANRMSSVSGPLDAVVAAIAARAGLKP